MTQPQDALPRSRVAIISKGHNPPQVVDQEIPTLETGVQGLGGPGRPFPRTAGTHPWIAGSFTIGSNKVWNLLLADLKSSSPNVWYLLRHNHSGTNTIPGGTVDAWHLPAAGHRTIGPAPMGAPLRSIRGPGTVFLYGFGARRALTGSTPFVALGTNTGHAYGASLRGYIE